VSLPAHMRDRWANRPEPPEGQGTVYWHALMGRYPEARSAASAAQSILGKFDGFHLTPPGWLHMTVLIAGSTEKVPREHLAPLLDAARTALDDVAAPAVALERVLYHPEAVTLAVEPAADLHAIRRRIDRVTAAVTGGTVDDAATARWVPHMTVGYSTSDQPASPVIAALGRSVPMHELVVDTLMLVVQWGAERSWNWERIGTVQLGHAALRADTSI
jgi:2'-5' RNA ligase